MTEVKIKYVSYGLANVIDDTIYLNKHLESRPDLVEPILKHEKKHLINKEGISADIQECLKVPIPGLNHFCYSHPSTWMQILPVWYIDKKIIIDKFMILYWILITYIITVGVIAYEYTKF